MKKINCYTTSVSNLLNYIGISAPEDMLLCADNFLDLECSTQYDAIYADVIGIVNRVLQGQNIQLGSTEIYSYDHCKRIFDSFGGVMLKVDCSKLTYSPLFTGALTSQRNHYIFVTQVYNQQIFVIDEYIPTMVQSSFAGWMSVSDYFFEGVTAYYVLNSQRTFDLSKSVIKENLLSSLNNALCNNRNKNKYVQFYDNISRLNILNRELSAKKVFLEMAATVGNGGILPTRLALTSLLGRCLDSQAITHEIEDLNEICRYYSVLSKVLLKLSFRISACDINYVLDTIEKLSALEERAFTNCKNTLNTRS